MSWISLSWSVHFYHDGGGSGASLALPELEDADVAGVAAMAMVSRLRRGEEIARKTKVESSGEEMRICSEYSWKRPDVSP